MLQPGFVQNLRSATGGIGPRCLFYDAEGPLWRGARKNALDYLLKANSEACVREVAYHLLSWIDALLARDPPHPELASAETFAADKELIHALWNAATVNPLAPNAAARIRQLPASLQRLGVEIKLPSWWRPTLAQLGIETGDDKRRPEVSS